MRAATPRLWLALAVALLPISATAPANEALLDQPVPSIAAEVRATPFSRFRIGADERRFGALEFVGGLELRSRARHFGSISGFRFTSTNGDFLAVTDTGYWMFGRLERDAAGKPAGFADVTLQAITDADGRPGAAKAEFDAESLQYDGGTAIVGFEQDHRIAIYDIAGNRASPEQGRIDFLIPRHELRRNAGFEALARAPADSHLAGALIVITERSLDSNGNLFAAILEGPAKGIFKVVREGSFSVTDAVFLPDGDLLLVERSFNFAEGVRLRLRRIALADIAPGRTVDGEELLRADMRYQIDNMEAVDAWLDADGNVRIALLSDDNQSFLQRNLYLEFKFAEPTSTGRNSENSMP